VIIYPLLALIGFGLLTMDGEGLYYITAVLAETGLIVILFLVSATLLTVLVPTLGFAKRPAILVFLSAGLVIALFVVLFLARSQISIPFTD
jgi:hypothetical protein